MTRVKNIFTLSIRFVPSISTILSTRDNRREFKRDYLTKENCNKIKYLVANKSSWILSMQLILNRAQGNANNVYYIEASSHAEIAEYRKSSDDDGAQFACFRFAAKRHALSRERAFLRCQSTHKQSLIVLLPS